METFGNRLRDLRHEAHVGMREFCLTIDMEPSNYSRMERDITPAPLDHKKLEPIRMAFGLSTESETWQDLLRLADLSRGMIPRKIMTNAEVMAKMPTLMRGLDGQGMTEEQIDDLVAMMRREHVNRPRSNGQTRHDPVETLVEDEQEMPALDTPQYSLPQDVLSRYHNLVERECMEGLSVEDQREMDGLAAILDEHDSNTPAEKAIRAIAESRYTKQVSILESVIDQLKQLQTISC